MASEERPGNERGQRSGGEQGQRLPDERGRKSGDWSETLAYGSDREEAVPERDADSDHWDRWHYGIYLGSALLLVGAFRISLPLILVGYVLVPVTMYLDSRYLEDVTVGWQADTGLHLVGSLLFPFVLVPMYLYRRREL